MVPNIRIIKKKLNEAFSEFDPDVLVNIYGHGEGYLEMDIVSERWESIRIFRRIEMALDIIDTRAPSIAEQFITTVCPVTKTEFADRNEDV